MVLNRIPWVFQDLVHEIDRMSRTATLAEEESSCRSKHTSVEVSVKENEASLVVDLPGVTPEDIDLVIENLDLRIEAKREDAQQAGEAISLRERSFGTFSRVYRLPWPVRDEDVEAELKQGVLRVYFRRAPESAPRKITIKTN
jgi:HSP20 family protein